MDIEPPGGRAQATYKGAPALIVCIADTTSGGICTLEARLFGVKVEVGDILDPSTSLRLWGAVRHTHAVLHPPYGPVEYADHHTVVRGVPECVAVQEAHRLSTAHHFYRTSGSGHKLYLAEPSPEGWRVYARINQERILTPAEASLIAEFDLLCDELAHLADQGLLTIDRFKRGALYDLRQLRAGFDGRNGFRIGCAGCAHNSVTGTLTTGMLRFDALLGATNRHAWITPTDDRGIGTWGVYLSGAVPLPPGYQWEVITGHHPIDPNDLPAALNELVRNFVVLVLDPSHVHRSN